LKLELLYVHIANNWGKITWSLIEHVTGNRAVYENAWKEIISEYFSRKENRRGVLWEFSLCFSDLQWITDVFSKCKHSRALLMSAQWGNHECRKGSNQPQKSKNDWQWGSLCSCRSEKHAVNFSNKGLHRWANAHYSDPLWTVTVHNSRRF